MKILILGASGMAGHVITFYLRENGYIVETLAANHPLDEKTHLLDVTDSDSLKKLLDTKKYDVIVNCIGILTAQSEARKDLAVYINSFLPHWLENQYKNSKTKVIHISTDDVFSYTNPPYNEESPYDGQTFYGRSKALGEIINSKDITFRMSIVGPDLRKESGGLINWFFTQKGEVQGYKKSIWNGVTTLELAKAVDAAIKQKLSGLYHLVPDKGISKYELLLLLKDNFALTNIEVKPADGPSVKKNLVNSRHDFKYKVPDYHAMIYDLSRWVESHRRLYKHYYE